MIVRELVDKLLCHSTDLKIYVMVDQEITGNSDYAWVKGDIVDVRESEIFLNEKAGDCGLYMTRDEMYEEVKNYPEKYFPDPDKIPEHLEDTAIINYLDAVAFEKVLLVDVKP